MAKIIFQIILFFIFLISILNASNNLPEKVTFSFKDADLKNVLLFFAEFEDKNFLIDEAINGKITIRLKDVPWKQALDIILGMRDLVRLEEGNIIRIVPMAVIKKQELEKIKDEERKKQLVPLETKVIYINFAKAADIEKRVATLLSQRGKLITDERTNSIIVTDLPDNIKEMLKIIDNMDQATRQVIIEAKIVYINDTASKELGIQWGGSLGQRITSKDFFYGISSGSEASTSLNIYPPGSDQKENNYNTISLPTGYAVNTPTIQAPTGTLGLIFGKWGYYNLSVKLSALKAKNIAKEISSPKVIALDNEKALIQQGQEVPYKTISDGGTKTEFKEATLKLEVTPHITSNKMISLDINLTKDSIGQQTTDGPAINKQQVTTKLLLADGETAVIGGILSNSEAQGEDSVPFFSDIPLLGTIFKNNTNSAVKGELLIFISPKIVAREKISHLDEESNALNINKIDKIGNSLSNKAPKKVVNLSAANKQSQTSDISITSDNKSSKNEIKESKPLQSSQTGDNLNVGYINVISLNLREKPDINSKIIAEIKSGEKVTIIDKDKYPWYYVTYKGNNGWVFKYLKLVN